MPLNRDIVGNYLDFWIAEFKSQQFVENLYYYLHTSESKSK